MRMPGLLASVDCRLRASAYSARAMCACDQGWAACCNTRQPASAHAPARTGEASPRVCLPCREIVKRIDMWGVDMLFVVGGNGGNAGANAINHECRMHDVNCAVVSHLLMESWAVPGSACCILSLCAYMHRAYSSWLLATSLPHMSTKDMQVLQYQLPAASQDAPCQLTGPS